MLNDATGYWVISFLDGNTNYNMIFMPEEHMSRTTCLGFVGLFKWIDMTFGFKMQEYGFDLS
jgi:hypothetical protein